MSDAQVARCMNTNRQQNDSVIQRDRLRQAMIMNNREMIRNDLVDMDEARKNDMLLANNNMDIRIEQRQREAVNRNEIEKKRREDKNSARSGVMHDMIL